MNARNLKALGLALATAFASASAASASTDHFTGNPGTKLKVTANEPQKFEPTTGQGKGFSCKTLKVNGELTAETGTKITLEPIYENCVTVEEGKETATPATVETRGCHYTFQGATTSGNPTGGEHANVELKCDTPGAGSPPGITIKATAFNLKCALVIPQTVEHAVRYETVTEKSTKVIPTAHGIEAETENSIACPGSERHADGSYTGSITVEGVHLVENATSSGFTDHFTGNPGTKLKVTANEPQKFEPTTGQGKGFSCKTLKVNGELKEETGTAITVEPIYENCVTVEEGKETATPTTVETRGCHFTFQGATTNGNPTGGEHANVELKCDTPGAGSPPGITIKATSLNIACLLVPPQTIKHAVRYETVTEKSTKVIPTAHGIEAETENSIACPGSERHADGSYTGSITVEGVHLVENATP